MRRLAIVVPLVSVVLTGCAVGNRYAYQSVVASPQVSGTSAVSVATHDQRDAMTTALVNTLAKKGFRAQPVVVAHSLPAPDARQQALRVGVDRALVLTLQEWKSDSAMRVGLTYDMALTVLDRTGAVLAEKRLQGHDNLGAASLPSHVGEIVAAAFKTKLEQLLDDPGVAGALRGSA
jgi:hypothetical protein